MDPNKYREFLLQNLPLAKPASGRSEVVCKCLYCPDNGDHYHMYVSIPKHENEPSKYNCFKCGSHGWVTHRKLIEWNIFDQDMSMELIDHYKGFGYNHFSNNGNTISILNNKFIRESELSELKLKYINNRLGLNLTYQDLIDNKIVLNINDIFQCNYIKSYTRAPSVINLLDQYFLGFISYDNNYINLKRLVPNGKLPEWVDERYINYNIFEAEDNSKKFYLSPTDIDLYNPNPIKVHIAEGPFDALSIKYNLRKDFYNNIYTAVAGNAYKGVLRQIISFIKLVSLEIHLYPDSDIENYVIKDFIDYVRPYGYNIFIHRNLIGKDMGESIDKIREYIDKVY